MRVVVLIAEKEYREKIIKNELIKNKFDVCVTSYEGVNKCLRNLKKFDWEYVVIDEAHRIKNDESLLSTNVRVLKSEKRLILTGTPLQNNMREL